MKNKKVYIRQLAGLGDILFAHKIAKSLISCGFPVVWPVIEEYSYIVEYIRHPSISFVSLGELSENEKELFKSGKFIETDDFVYIPLDCICHSMGNCNKVMLSKYDFFKMNCENWQDSIDLIRNKERENALREYLKLEEEEPFVFVNRLFASPPDSIYVNYTVNTNYRIIENKKEYMNKFRLFDFCWLLENAKEIHTVETSLCYIVELLKTTDNIFLYPRMLTDYQKQYPDYKYIEGVYRKKWNYMEM